MPPDFNKTTVETLAKRAHYFCSNPDCRKSTVGPNSDPAKATVIGEAAHIHGKRPGSKRYRAEMTDHTRAEITNGIWLCRNCHKEVDSDEQNFPTQLLFSWREAHETYIAHTFGNASDQLLLESKQEELHPFSEFPPRIRRILIDRPMGWEYRLTAELLRELNGPIMQRYADLVDGVYTKPLIYIKDDELFDWTRAKVGELTTLVSPIGKLFSRLMESWGQPGEPGDAKAILANTRLLSDALSRILEFEETITFTEVSTQGNRMRQLLKGQLGDQIEKFADLPRYMDEMIELHQTGTGGTPENPTVVEKTITIELPDNWADEFERELHVFALNTGMIEPEFQSGRLPWLLIIFLTILFLFFYLL